MGEFGNFTLVLGWLLSLAAVVSGVIAGRTNSSSWFASSRNATIAAALCLIAATAALAAQFLADDYTNQFVWQFSNRSMPWPYKISAVWGGMDGSMLLWCMMLGVSGGILALQSKDFPRPLRAWVLVGFHTTLLFFASVVVFLTNPFRYINAPFIPPDGNGLNPLLQNPYMAVHPPTLYLGFTTFAIPYAICLGALLSGSLNNEWLRLSRRWTLVAWGFLTAGIVLGGHWAYLELGWGGFWAWDPVENASFLPWLTGTAFLHSVMVQERRGMLKLWNVWLIVLTYGLTVFGTFLTRSGIVQSVHAFASTDIGWTFVSYLVAMLVIAIYLSFRRREALVPERSFESIFSREVAFLLNNLVFLSICFAVLWGVMFPVLSEAVTGSKQTIGIPFFNRVTIPMFLAMIGLMGIGPLLAWRRTNLGAIRRAFLFPFVFAIALCSLVVWSGGLEFLPSLTYGLCAFVLLAIGGEVHRGLRVQMAATPSASLPGATVSLFRRHRSRYGGHIIHFGVLVMVVAITASMAHKTEHDVVLGAGESHQVGRFIITLEQLQDYRTENYHALVANTTLRAANSGAVLTTLLPELRRYSRNGESTTEVALRMSLREDVYLVMAGLDDSGSKAALRIFINPLQVWLWIGTAIVILGTLFVLGPWRLPVFQQVTARITATTSPPSNP